jgi:hypothetical protein
VIFRARHVMMAMGLIVTFLGNASASSHTVTVQDPRPVAEAIQELPNTPVNLSSSFGTGAIEIPKASLGRWH